MKKFLGKKKNLSKKLLIVGGTGFLGYHVAIKAKKKKWEVHSISSRKPKKKRLCKEVKYLICDITSKKDLNKLLKTKYDYIINFGGYVDHSNKKKTYSTHFIGCKNLIDILQKKKITPSKFVQIGSSIENLKSKSPQSELYPKNNYATKSVYGDSKLLASRYLINLYKKNNYPVVILRPYIIYGPKQDSNRFIPFVIENCKKNKKFNLSSCEQYRDFLFIDDFIRLIFKIFGANSKSHGNIFNVGYGKPIKLKKIVKLVRNKIDKGLPDFGKLKLRPDEIKIQYPNINKTKKFFSWSPKTKFINGLIKTINQN
ncbi:NAD-dependent epimerase/dehydratase family protein [Candidatus Pelagibacter sp.]|nr:NAD-dependent epimerase/dehydratase family protein [Candidatus Pelagibacter sp.]